MKKNKYIFIMILTFFMGMISVSATAKVSCGNVTKIPAKIPELSSFVVTLLQVAIPVILVIMGSLDLFKGITAAKDDEIKKGQHMLIKRLIVAALIFFVVAIVKFVIGLVSNGENTQNMVECIDCFINNDCKSGAFTCDSVDNTGMTVVVNEYDECTLITYGTVIGTAKCDYIPDSEYDCDKVGIKQEPHPHAFGVYMISTYKKNE